VLSAVLVVVLVLVGTAPVHDDFHKAQIIFVDVGQGDCIHIRTSGGKNILIDGGGSRNFDVGRRVLMPYLLKNGVRRIDLAIVSHMHLDHYGGIFSLANHFQIDQIGFYEANKIIEDEIVSQTGLQREQIVYFTKGQKIMIDQGVWIEVLYPPQKSVEEYRFLKGGGANENDLSLILKVYYYGVSTLLMGDMTFEGERSLLSKYQDDDGRLNSDILKIGHHGSRFSTSDELLAAVRPDFAVFQVGRNGFGHPTREVLEKVDGINAAIYRNDKHGAIGVFIRRGEENPTIRTIILEK
ncbi:MAG: MBL fold metallo-hydrolase, partial [Clostridiales bacterium]|nr:MBL fold metallo-hydrolase [Clostridiales bacterium]